jgi:DNA-binding NarL/FixJ family response regulator
MPDYPIYIQIHHEDAVVSAGIRALLSASEQFCLTTDAAAQPGVLIADYEHGMAAAASRRVLIITHLDREAQVRRAIARGVCGYLLQGCSAEELALAVTKLSQGQRHLSQAVMDWLLGGMELAPLTLRETDVLQLLGKGCCNKTIARELGIGVGTVKTHLKALMTKLNATARTHAVVLASQRGLLMLDA